MPVTPPPAAATKWMLSAVLAIAALPALANDAPPARPPLPDLILRRIAGNPDRFLAEMTAVIRGGGAGDAIDRAGLDAVLAVEGAADRASALRPLIAADLDGDGTVRGDEVAILAPTLASGPRARLRTAISDADADGSGDVTWDEARAYAAAVAEGRSRADRLHAALAFDADHDGRIDLAELARGLAALKPVPLGADLPL